MRVRIIYQSKGWGSSSKETFFWNKIHLETKLILNDLTNILNLKKGLKLKLLKAQINTKVQYRSQQ